MFQRAGVIERDRSASLNVLEIGCGSGFTTQDLAIILPRATITGIDADPMRIVEANELLVSGDDRIQFHHKTGEECAKDWEEHFDVVCMRFVLVHVPDPIALIEAAKKTLKPGGILLIEDCDATGYIMDPPSKAVETLHERHIELSLALKADVRRGPWIGGYLKQVGFKDNSSHAFCPLFGKGVTVEPWCPDGPLGNFPDSLGHFERGVDLLRMSLESVRHKMLEKKISSEAEMDGALQSSQAIPDYQLFSIPGGKIFQWWATKPTLNPGDKDEF